ncbi:protein translocase subunit SecD [Roseovarius sp. B08]|uniref:protein translocase subunit SecD n=1 Tax=Roseovarius sp. B08 TaxID=3449223 RepID=UPI003EDC7E6E
MADRPLVASMIGEAHPALPGLETSVLKLPLWRFALYLLVILTGLAVALPTFLPRNLAQSWPTSPVSLGLDLRGGASLTLRADEAAIRSKLLSDFAGALTEAEQGLTTRATDDGYGLIITEPSGMTSEAVLSLARQHLPEVGGGPLSQAEPTFSLATGDNSVVATLRSAAVALVQEDAVARSIEVIRNRIDEAGVAEPSIQSMGRDRILVQMPGIEDPAGLRALLGATAELTFHRVVPADTEGALTLTEAGGVEISVVARPALDGELLADASATFDPESGAPLVQFRFDTEGARTFGELTQDLVGQRFAIVLDGEVISAPVIQEPILGGSGVISGAFTVEETTRLAALLSAGALPVPLEIIEERTVGADLGADAIAMGLWTGLAGFALIAVMMMALYGAWGAVATAALLINVALTVAALVLLGATLTLPGIAGLILGMGLAVDANVLINERIREEARGGRRAASAVHAGFDRAYRAILDSNLTSLIATVLLFWLGSGPVRGFALTMGIGIVISLFTAVAVVRAAMDIHLRTWKLKTFEIRPLFRFLASETTPSFRFMRARVAALAVSLVLSVASIGLFIAPGLNYGVDFRSGALIEARSDAPADLSALRASVQGLNLGEVSLQESHGGRSILIRVEEQPGGEAAQTAVAKEVRSIVSEVSPSAEIDRTEIVGPRVSDELAVAGLIAVAVASLAMLIYIWVRFDWPYAVGAIATLVLDVTKVVGFLALTGLDFGLTAIAALLTLIGYSVNDKVVVYDRMRENTDRHPDMPLRTLIDLSINQTLARSLYTSGTALLAMLPMAIWGGTAVQSFAIPMIFGILVAALSSIFIAAPILLLIGDWRRHRGQDGTPSTTLKPIA